MSEQWTAERITRWRMGAKTERSTMVVRTSDFLSLLDALESAREEARIDREQCDHMTSEAAAMAEELAAHRWIAVTPETMPERGRIVLAHYLFGGREPRVRDAAWDGQDIWRATSGRIGTPTHWMPLPSPPVLP